MKKLSLYFLLSISINQLTASDSLKKQKLVEGYKEVAKEHSLPDVEKTCEAISQEKDDEMAKIYFAFLVMGGMSNLEKNLERQKFLADARGW